MFVLKNHLCIQNVAQMESKHYTDNEYFRFPVLFIQINFYVIDDHPPGASTVLSGVPWTRSPTLRQRSPVRGRRGGVSTETLTACLQSSVPVTCQYGDT